MRGHEPLQYPIGEHAAIDDEQPGYEGEHIGLWATVKLGDGAHTVRAAFDEAVMDAVWRHCDQAEMVGEGFEYPQDRQPTHYDLDVWGTND